MRRAGSAPPHSRTRTVSAPTPAPGAAISPSTARDTRWVPKCSFGRDPEFVSIHDEYRQPDLIDTATGIEVPDLYELLSGLLDWDPRGRLTGDAVKKHPYFLGVDWELLDRRTMRSPLLSVLSKPDGASSKSRSNAGARS